RLALESQPHVSSSVHPPAAFISSSAASDIIDSDQEFNAADFVPLNDESGASAAALVTPAALSLLNGFLDNLLFNILAASKSTQLACIRPAVSEVLKPRLASEVVDTADEELGEYMGEVQDDKNEFRGGQEPSGDFDLVRSWKLTRLRCMVYTRLGDMEEEDEDEYIAQDGLGESDGAPRRFSSHVDNVTPAAAIFLTSIIEHIGERALTARSRLSAKLNDSASGSVDLEEERKRIDRLVVEDLDMEKLALNATLGRLWRTWRKRRRNTTLSRTLSRESFRRRGHATLAGSRKSSIATIEEPVTPKEPVPEVQPPPVEPANIPLPIGDYDVQEIEVPGFSHELEGEVQTMQAVVAHKVRPRSLMVFTSPSIAPKSPGARDSPVSASAIDDPKMVRHIRSRSLPNAAAIPPRDIKTEPTSDDAPSPSASEKSKQLETMYEDDESAEFVDAAESAPGIAITTPIEEKEDPTAAESLENARMSIVQEEDEDQAEKAPPVNETIASLRSSANNDTDQSDSARVSVASLRRRTNQRSGGRGMCEKPKSAATIQRPRRKPSRDTTAHINATAIVAETSESDVQSFAEEKPTTQGAEATSVPPGATIEAINTPNDEKPVEGDHDKSAMASTSPIVSVNEDNAPSEKPSPNLASLEPDNSRPTSASGDSQYSQKSRTRHRPSPLVVTASNRSSSSGAERAAVQRMHPRPSSSSAQPAKSRRSESFSSSRDKRPVTAGSTTSQKSSKITRLMGRPGESPSLRLRSSSDTSRASGSADSDGNDTTDLDKLINSDETIHYTLTPKSVREMTFPDPTRPIPRSDTADTSDLADFLKNTAPPGEDARPPTSLSTRANGEVTSLGRVKSAESPKYIPISSRMPPPKSPKSPKSPTAGSARDARPAQDSTREIAEFIKSTGPATPTSSQAGSPAPTINGARSSRRQSTISASTNNTNSTYNTNKSSKSRQSTRNTRRPQARTPAETKRSQTSELIDFIREGPPQPGAHRIPRSVAPFRNTIDSEDLQYDSVQQNEKDAATNGSMASSAPNKSMTSLGSRTGLLESANRPNAQVKVAPPAKPVVQDDPMPVRKQRRVPDPYAIDDDDDDDMLEELIDAKPPPRQEESLMDFLRNAPPPPQPTKHLNPPPSSNGSTGLKSRFLRANTDKTPSSKKSLSSLRSQDPSATIKEITLKNETSALADFLRNTGPPEPPARPKKDNSFSRFFVRRKKVEV
ncbi:hypothetical protein N7450_008655, partial [Penicillium hetheringtonii]